jgi:hypothetical protein
MVGCVFVEIGEAEQEFEHAIPFLGIWLDGSFFEIRHDREGIREKLLDDLRVNGVALAAALHHFAGAVKRFVEEMVEADLLAGEAGRDSVHAGGSATNSSDGCAHKLITLGQYLSKSERVAQFL